MPDEDGESLAQWIGRHAALNPVGLMMVTSAAQSGDAERFRRAGFSAYFVKPVRSAMLMEGLAAVLGAVEVGTPLADIITRHTLDQRHPRVGAAATAHSTPREGDPRPLRRALIAEDNAVNQLIVRKLLERAGWVVAMVGDGDAAVDHAAAERFDVILMDCEMPRKNGYEATIAIRQAERSTRHTPIIALTATAMQGDRARCLAAGMDDYVSKPIRVDLLMAVLDRWCPRPHIVDGIVTEG